MVVWASYYSVSMVLDLVMVDIPLFCALQLPYIVMFLHKMFLAFSASFVSTVIVETKGMAAFSTYPVL